MAQVSEEDSVPHAVDLKVGGNIRRFRKGQGKSQEWLAGVLGLTFQQIQKYERGANRVSASKLHEISVALQIPIQHFFDGVEGLVTNNSAEELARQRAIQEQNASIDSAAAKLRRTADELEQAKI